MVYIGVIGESVTDQDGSGLAFEVGRLIARSGAALVCGGLSGVMEHAARGAKSERGLTIGILPGTRREDANPYIDISIPTGLGEARNVIVVRCSDAIVAIGGQYGTLSEIAFALKLEKPLVGLKTWELRHYAGSGNVIRCAETPQEAVETLFQLLKWLLETEGRHTLGERPTRQDTFVEKDLNYYLRMIRGDFSEYEEVQPAKLRGPFSVKNIVILFQNPFIGDGKKELGLKLLDAFLKSLINNQVKPRAIILLNRAVNLAVETEVTVSKFVILEEQGCKIMVCATSADEFDVSNKLKVGFVASMDEIAEQLLSAWKVISF
jgi:uncharacterized protein (TIGR00725 family)